VFLRWEQGFGDTLQFCRYAQMVRQRGAKVVMSVQDPVLRLLKQLEPGIEIVGATEEPDRFDFQCALMSLPLVFGTTLETIPSKQSYLGADPDLAAQHAAHLPSRTGTRIGLVWSGGADHKSDRRRSSRFMQFSQLQPLFTADADWVCLQKEIRDSDTQAIQQATDVTFLVEKLTDFADTAAVIDQLDLVITIDTGVAHLAGAMGKPVWILLPFSAEWRWLSSGDSSPWYPSARLFRQPKIGDWSSVIERVRAELLKNGRS